MSNVPAPKSFKAEEAENLEDIEKQFAVKALLSVDTSMLFRSKAVQHMSTYWGLLEKIRGSRLRLTKMDDDIYEHLKRDFPEFDPTETIDEDKMKSKSGKERWRNFMMAYEKKVEDYNFGTLLRSNPKFEYGEKETIFVPRMQFYAIEIARNRSGLNDWIYVREHPDEEIGRPQDTASS
ncbi:MAG: hypothetical protein M1839_007372 [Geoglossum umbratile]|nr:MAG: hypothetical protein M1839_007372 [Geoglossum umbratile]